MRLRPHVQATGNLSFFQSAYRPGYSTESALLKVVGDIERAAGNGMCTVLLVMDISAAFDAVNHLILCRRIESDFGVTGTALSWLRSFVSDRSQYVAVGSVKSETRRPTGQCVGAVVVCNVCVRDRRCYPVTFSSISSVC